MSLDPEHSPRAAHGGGFTMSASDCSLSTAGACTVTYGSITADLCTGVVPTYNIGGGSITATFCHSSQICGIFRFQTNTGTCNGVTSVEAYVTPGYAAANLWLSEVHMGTIAV